MPLMKIVIFALLATLVTASLTVGYYRSFEDEETRYTFFIKKVPTFQLRFRNIFANEGDPKPLERLRPDEREKVIEYCRYRLGIDTKLETQAELDACKVR